MDHLHHLTINDSVVHLSTLFICMTLIRTNNIYNLVEGEVNFIGLLRRSVGSV